VTDLDATSTADDRGLSTALAGLGALIAGRSSLQQLLTEVSSLAVLAVPGADGAGVTMLDSGRPDTIVSSTPFVHEIDSVQYRLGEGPCISAAASARTTGSGALGEDAAWPTFGPMAAALDIHSALSLPLAVDDEVLGALNVYAHARHAFDGSSRHVGELFAGPAAVAVHNARMLSRTMRSARQRETDVTARSTIDHAVGILMARSGSTADEAFVRLRIMSQHRHLKLSVVAAQLVDEAVRRAQARNASPE
jgi:GAF domain-containing protein